MNNLAIIHECVPLHIRHRAYGNVNGLSLFRWRGSSIWTPTSILQPRGWKAYALGERS